MYHYDLFFFLLSFFHFLSSFTFNSLFRLPRLPSPSLYGYYSYLYPNQFYVISSSYPSFSTTTLVCFVFPFSFFFTFNSLLRLPRLSSPSLCGYYSYLYRNLVDVISSFYPCFLTTHSCLLLILTTPGVCPLPFGHMWVVQSHHFPAAVRGLSLSSSTYAS